MFLTDEVLHHTGSFPELGLRTDQTGLTGPVLVPERAADLLYRRTVYRYCVKAFDKMPADKQKLFSL